MSFRLFIYYSAVGGAWAAFFGWLFGRIPLHMSGVLRSGLKGLLLGLAVALVLALLDALWNYSIYKVFEIVPRVVVAAVIGSTGGLLCGVVGQALINWIGEGVAAAIIQIMGWTVAGLLIGTSLGLYDLLLGLLRQQSIRGSLRKFINGALGGTLGGLLGSSLLVALAWALFRNKAEPWSPGAIGFVTLGACVGLLIGLSQVLLKEAWLRVESGFRPGRELILAKPELTIGRAENCDVGLFGDNSVERLHARIYVEGERYYLMDNGTPSGTYLNDVKIAGPTPLSNGDRIRVGRNVLFFGERARSEDKVPRLR
jgi:hypothetical protein